MIDRPGPGPLQTLLSIFRSFSLCFTDTQTKGEHLSHAASSKGKQDDFGS